MGGTEIDYQAFTTFLTNVSESVAGESGTTSSSMSDILQGAKVIGSLNTASAMSFKALNGKASRAIGAFMSDQALGRIALANAAACCAVTYHDGDINQSGVVDGIFSPKPGTAGTVRTGSAEPAKSGDPVIGDYNGDGKVDQADKGTLPEQKLDADGNLVDANGNILVKADGTIVNPSAVSQNPSAYTQYVTGMQDAQYAYKSYWTGMTVEQLKSSDPKQYGAAPSGDKAKLSATQQALADAYAQNIRPSEAPGTKYKDGYAPAAPVSAEQQAANQRNTRPTSVYSDPNWKPAEDPAEAEEPTTYPDGTKVPQ